MHHLLVICILGLVYFQVGLAKELPPVPEMGEDFELTSGKSMEVFFNLRVDDTACRARLEKAQISFFELREKLIKLVDDGASKSKIEKTDLKMQDARYNMLMAISECGDCATHEAIAIPVTLEEGGSKVNMYKSDGSCLIDLDAFGLTQAAFYDRVKEWLLKAGNYNQRNNGFDHVLEYAGVEVENEEVTLIKDPPNFPPNAFMASKAEGPFQFLRVYTYYVSTEKEERIGPDLRELQLRFKHQKKPPGFERPRLHDRPLTKEVIPILNSKIEPLRNVKAMWYVHSGGYLRYYMAVVFKKDLGVLAKAIAKEILLKTLVELVERVFPEVR